MKIFKAVYNAPNETAVLTELEGLKEKWGKKYPYAISNWENNWTDVSSLFQFSDDIRRIMLIFHITVSKAIMNWGIEGFKSDENFCLTGMLSSNK